MLCQTTVPHRSDLYNLCDFYDLHNLYYLLYLSSLYYYLYLLYLLYLLLFSFTFYYSSRVIQFLYKYLVFFLEEKRALLDQLIIKLNKIELKLKIPSQLTFHLWLQLTWWLSVWLSCVSCVIYWFLIRYYITSISIS